MRSRVTSGIVAGVVLGIGSLIISACGSSGASSTASPGTSSGTQSASAASAAIPTLVNLPCSKDQGLKGDVVGLNFEESESVFSQLQSDIEEFAKLSNCGLTFKVTNAQGDPATQVQQAEELITDWEPAAYGELAPEHLERIFALSPEVVVIGTGPQQQFASFEVRAAFAQRRIGLEVMNLGAACRTFNVLVGEQRRVAAVLLI